MVKFLNGTGLQRLVSKIKAALDRKQDKKLVVTISNNSGTITADKTYAEILAAYNSGADIVVDDGYGNFYHLIAFDVWFYFKGTPYDETSADYYLSLSNQNVWRESGWYAQPQLVSGTNIKTINNQSLLGSGDITIQSGSSLTAGDGIAITNDVVRTTGIPFGIVDTTSTNKAFTVTVPGIYKLEDGVCCLVKNGVVTSASGFTLNVNGLGAKQCYNNMAAATAETNIFNVNYTMLFVYDSTRVAGGGWICYRGYDSTNSNSIGYQLRTNNTTLKTTDTCRYYKIFFTSADGTHWVPASVDSTNNATAIRGVNQRPIDPFGRIVYTSATTNYTEESNVTATSIWDQYTLSLGYSFNRTGTTLTLTQYEPVYIKCAPQNDGSAIIDASTPYVQVLPSTADGKIYIYLGIAYSATQIELTINHPIYYHDGIGIRLWTGKDSYSKTQIDSALNNKQDVLISGTNIKTVEGNSLLGSGNININSNTVHYEGQGTTYVGAGDTLTEVVDELSDAIDDLGAPNEIASITTTESSASGGNNTVTINTTDGVSKTFNVKNGKDGANGTSLGDVEIADNLTTDDSTKVLSAKQGKLLGDDVDRIKDYEFGVKTYTEADLTKDKSYGNNGSGDLSRMTVLANYACIKIPVTKGDKLTIASYGASGPRTYSLCDNELNIYDRAASGLDTTSNPVTVDVTQDGYCHVNCRSAAYANFSVIHYYSLERQMLDDNTRALTNGEMEGTSQWITDKLEALGWEYDMYMKNNGTSAVQAGYCVTPFIPIPSSIAGHSLTIRFMFDAWSTGRECFYDSNKSFISGHYLSNNADNQIITTINSAWTSDAYVRMTCNPDKISECFIRDNTTGEYIWRGDKYLSDIYEDNTLSFKSYSQFLIADNVEKMPLFDGQIAIDTTTSNVYIGINGIWKQINNS